MNPFNYLIKRNYNSRIDESIQLFNKEKLQFNFKFDLVDYSRMCSYLSFRYRKNNNDLLWIEKVVIPNFILFFKKIGFNDIQVNSVINLIFDSFFKIQRKQKWKILSPIVNLFNS